MVISQVIHASQTPKTSRASAMKTGEALKPLEHYTLVNCGYHMNTFDHGDMMLNPSWRIGAIHIATAPYLAKASVFGIFMSKVQLPAKLS
jgi:hypothetical protein